MKKQFDKYFNKNSKQKAVFKMGGAHIVKGIGPNGVKTLGNYVINKALQNNSNALVVGAFNYNDDLEFVEQDIFKNSDIVLLDCSMYIKSISDSLLNSFSTRNKSLLLGNDAIVLFNDFKYAKKSIIKPHQKTFRLNLIKQVSIGAILIIICFSSLIPLLIYYFRKNKKTTAYLLYGRVLTKTFLAFIVLLSVIIFQIKSILSSESKAAILNASSSIWIYIFLCFIALYFVYKSIRFLQTEGKQKYKTYLMLITTSFLLLVGFMYYWNIGGMISF